MDTENRQDHQPDAAPDAAPDPARHALFLDLDGTLLDLAETPDQVAPEPGLSALLLRLETLTSGALALVTGRQVAFVDALLPVPHAPEHRFTVAGLHGAELRPGTSARPGVRAIAAPAKDNPSFQAAYAGMKRAAQSLGLLTEDKGAAFALHYRLAPDMRRMAERIMAEAAETAGPGYQLRAGKCVIELCPAGADKGKALRNLMAFPPFKTRRPLAAGDDLTDEAMFRVVNDMGGLSIHIGAPGSPSVARASIASPGAFRAWLRQLAGMPGAGD